MMNRLKYIAWILLLFASCTETEEGTAREGISVEVTREVRISLQPMQVVGTPATRTAVQTVEEEAIHLSYEGEAATRVWEDETDMTAAEQAINNAYILQFSGTAATSVLKKKQGITAEQLRSGAPLTCSFVMTSGAKNRVYVVANCTKTLTEGTTTLGDFEAPVTMSPATAVPAGGLPFSACQDVGVGDEFEPFLVKSVLAKLTFTCKTTSATLKLKGLPVGYSFYTQAVADANKVRPTGMTYNNSGVALTSGTTYYVPENLSGHVNLSAAVVRIAEFAPADAMWVEIGANSTTYTVYLGDGTPQEFNVAGNCAYQLAATLLGSSRTDLRVGTPSITALDTEGTANCYIAAIANQWYSFNGTVMGNGATVPEHLPGAISGDIYSPAIIPTPLNPRTSDVLWETWNTIVTPTPGSVVRAAYVANGRILFRTSTQSGNAVIAARDADNTIIWSWHIWRLSVDQLPNDFPLAAIGDLTVDNELVLMDRNLGALSAKPQDDLSTGLHYQWGRKDPFPAYAGLTSPNNVAMATYPSGVSTIPSSSTQYTIAQSIQEPTTFLLYNGDWCSPRNDNLWGTPLTTSISMNGSNYNVNKGMKSIYDPCPVGWRTSLGYVFANASKSNGGTFNKGYSFAIGQSNATNWFPASGYRGGNSGALSDVGSFGGYWTSTLCVGSPTFGNLLNFYSSTVYPVNYNTRAVGYSVRCVKEDFNAKVPGAPVNLSAKGTANCYIVPKAGAYCFDATVMGNGRTVPAHTKGAISGDADFPAITPSTLAPASVEVLWETFNTTTAPTKGDVVSDVVLEGGRVIFNTGSKEGNAVIAVKNAGGTIIWSWHIWRTNSQPKEFPLAAIGSLTIDGEIVLMDRNLGALSATANDNFSTGLHYQWGRKDPFPAYAGLTSPNNVVMATTPNGMPILPSSTGQYSIAQSIQQPTTFLKASGDWCSTRNDNLWGTPITTSVSINGNACNANKGMKSIYDPCPPGWRISPDYAFANAVTSGSTGNGFWSSNGWNLKMGQSSAISWFPASGYRSRSSGGVDYVGAFGHFWTSTPSVGGPNYGSKLGFGSSGVNLANYDGRAVGYSCRCCRE